MFNYTFILIQFVIEKSKILMIQCFDGSPSDTFGFKKHNRKPRALVTVPFEHINPISVSYSYWFRAGLSTRF